MRRHNLTLSHNAILSETKMALQVLYAPLFIILSFLVHRGHFNLSVNIKSKRGDIVRQTFKSDPQGDVVTVNYKLNEGQFIEMLVDFRKVCCAMFVGSSLQCHCKSYYNQS